MLRNARQRYALLERQFRLNLFIKRIHNNNNDNNGYAVVYYLLKTARSPDDANWPSFVYHSGTNESILRVSHSQKQKQTKN